MSGDSKGPVERAFRASLLVLGIAFALNMAIEYLRSVVPWLIGVVVAGAIAWIVVAIIRWRRSKW